MPKEDDYQNLRKCLDNYSAERIYIRDCGGIREDGKYSIQGLQKVNEDLEGRVLDVKLVKEGFLFLIDNSEIFLFENWECSDKGFSLGYERREEDGREIHLPCGINPDDPKLPEPERSKLRHNNLDHLLEIYFPGKIPLKFHSWMEKPYWKYWEIDV